MHQVFAIRVGHTRGLVASIKVVQGFPIGFAKLGQRFMRRWILLMCSGNHRPGGRQEALRRLVEGVLENRFHPGRFGIWEPCFKRQYVKFAQESPAALAGSQRETQQGWRGQRARPGLTVISPRAIRRKFQRAVVSNTPHALRFGATIRSRTCRPSVGPGSVSPSSVERGASNTK